MPQIAASVTADPFSIASPIGKALARLAPLLPLLTTAIWQLIGAASGKVMPASVVIIAGSATLPGIVLYLRRHLQSAGSIMSASTAVFGMHYVALAIGVPATWYFEPPESYFGVYDAAIPYLLIHLILMCGVRGIGIWIVGNRSARPTRPLSSVPMSALFIPQVAHFMIVAYLVSVGAFFHTAHGDYMFENPIYGPLTMLRLGLALLLPVWGREVFVQKYPHWRWIYTGTVALHVVTATLAGSRELVLNILLLSMIGPVLSGRLKVRLREVVGVLAVFVVLSTFVEFYRSALSQDTGGSAVTMFSEVETAGSSGRTNLESSDNALAPLMLRFDDFRPFAVLHAYYRTSEGPFLDGRTFLTILVDPIPRVFWHDKPSPSDIAQITGRLLREGGSSPLTVPGEFYVNFGDEGAIIGGLATGLLWILMDMLFDRRRYDPIVLGLFSLELMALGLFNSSPTGLIGGMYKLGGFAWAYRAVALWAFSLVSKPTRMQPRVTVP